MEKREKILQQAEDLLKSANLTVDDFVQYCAEKETVKAKVSVQNFAFEVMYEGMVRSWVPLKGKKPLGVIFENHLITLHDSPRTMPWREAVKYCQSVKIEGHACSAGKIGFWKKLADNSEWQKRVLDELLVMLGGDSVAASRKWHWSSSESVCGEAWAWCYVYGYLDESLKVNYCFVVRPVLNLSELS